MGNIDHALLEEVARQEKLFTAIMHTGLTAMCVFVLFLIGREAFYHARRNGWKETCKLAYVIVGAIALLFVCVRALSRLHTIVTAWVIVTTNGASAGFCEGVATVTVLGVCGLVALWIYEVCHL